MSLEGSFQNLSLQLHNLHEALMALRTTALEDKPQDDDAVLVEMFANAADDLLGWLEGAQMAIGYKGDETKVFCDLQELWKMLTSCQARVNQIQQIYTCDLAIYERLIELSQFAERRGGEWEGWAVGVHIAIFDCRMPLLEVTHALLTCWQAMGDRLLMPFHIQTQISNRV